MSNILPVIQIIISFLLIVVIILQQKGTGLSGAFGGGGDGGGGGGNYHTRRGFERVLFISTVVLATLFLLSTLIALLIR